MTLLLFAALFLSSEKEDRKYRGASALIIHNKSARIIIFTAFSKELEHLGKVFLL